MCDCYKIGGPWIAEDPNCPIHGHEAQRENAEREAKSGDAEERISQLERGLAEAMRRIQALENIGAKY